MMVRFMRVVSFDGEDQGAGTAKLIDGKVTFSNDIPDIARDAQAGLPDGKGGKVFPRDGETFLRALPINYRGSYFYAELVK